MRGDPRLYNAQGDLIEFDEYTDRHLRKVGRGVVVATDMDNTMVDRDLGVLVFIEKLKDPHFWDLDPDAFEQLVIPAKYYGILSEGAHGHHGDNLPPRLCQLALDLHEDIVHLYREIQRIKRDESASPHQTPVILEFARKMIEIDRAFMEADRYLSVVFEGELLMRTRFFAGKELGDVHHVTKKVLQRTSSDPYRMLDLAIPDEGRIGAVSEEKISDVYGEDSPRRTIDRYVPIIVDVQRFTRRALKQRGVIGLVITANLQGIGTTTVRNTDYSYFKKQKIRGKHLRGAVIGSRLIKNGGKLGPKMEDLPVFGERKAEKAREFAQKNGDRRLACAIGDSPGTDGPMLRASLEEGGTAIMVGESIEEMERRFAPVLKIEELQDDAHERIFYILANEQAA